MLGECLACLARLSALVSGIRQSQGRASEGGQRARGRGGYTGGLPLQAGGPLCPRPPTPSPSLPLACPPLLSLPPSLPLSCPRKASGSRAHEWAGGRPSEGFLLLPSGGPGARGKGNAEGGPLGGRVRKGPKGPKGLCPHQSLYPQQWEGNQDSSSGSGGQRESAPAAVGPTAEPGVHPIPARHVSIPEARPGKGSLHSKA